MIRLVAYDQFVLSAPVGLFMSISIGVKAAALAVSVNIVARQSASARVRILTGGGYFHWGFSSLIVHGGRGGGVFSF